MDKHFIRLNTNEKGHKLPNRTRYIPYVSRDVFELPYIKFLSHAVTPLMGSESTWHANASYQHQFVIEDYDFSKDYHLNIEGIQQHCQIFINQLWMGSTEAPNSNVEWDVTQALHEGTNEIEVVAIEDHGLTNQMMFRDMYLLERANDRIVDYDVEVAPNQRGDLKVCMQIKDIEGAPLITYTLQNEQKMTLAKGQLDIDSCHHILIPAHLVNQRHRYFTLFLETDDETIAHYIEITGRHAPVNVKFNTIFEQSRCV
ncbi:sugar-binding domain-containing protein [Staphylococcus lutrae]|uniref:Beta-galactosidase n=1 Tax=Staphylococcus lutrae TaxID=155085 RepID=A0AAC9RN58_9STAP|nr:sugar-binding domain-containing protein [Staphylococcus lutrae]ARJ50498.1 hypothetical protein B5P37_03820 [Staphylococcus lutrae]PNZ37399.1 hypothetical protein CD134_06375 [Staphylococcus lutrae]